MKTIKIVTTIILVSLVTTSLFAQKKKTEKKDSKDEITVQVDGLGCPFCAYGLEKKMKELDGVKAFKIEMESGLTTFTYPTERKISIEDVRHQVTKAGYTPMSLSIKRADGSFEESKYETHEVDYTANQTIEFEVAGNCNMCKGRIERAAMGLYGVANANWNKRKKIIKVEYLDTEVSEKQIHQVISGAGYDTDKMIAFEDVYNSLPGCCQYKRMNADLITPFEEKNRVDNVD